MPILLLEALLLIALIVITICTIAIAYINDKKEVKEPISDDGIIVDRVWVKKDNVHDWLAQKEAEGCVLTAQALASLFYLYE